MEWIVPDRQYFLQFRKNSFKKKYVPLHSSSILVSQRLSPSPLQPTPTQPPPCHTIIQDSFPIVLSHVHPSLRSNIAAADLRWRRLCTGLRLKHCSRPSSSLFRPAHVLLRCWCKVPVTPPPISVALSMVEAKEKERCYTE